MPGIDYHYPHGFNTSKYSGPTSKCWVSDDNAVRLVNLGTLLYGLVGEPYEGSNRRPSPLEAEDRKGVYLLPLKKQGSSQYLRR